MPYAKFLLYNLSGAALWALTMVSLAYFVGQVVPLERLIGWVAQFGVLALVAVVGGIGGAIWLEQRKLTKATPHD
jgi:membrane protein DedA with SNARE-associated domain